MSATKVTAIRPAEEPSRRERQRLETRERIYAAAIEEFRRVGFQRAQIETIVERAGVARGTFYFHFPTKEAVLVELQRRHQRDIVERLRAIPKRGGSVTAFLEGLIDAITADAASSADVSLASDVLATYVRAPRHVELTMEPLVVALVDYFTEAQERGEVRSDLAPEEIADVFLTQLFGFVIGAVDSIENRLGDLRRSIDVFARGIAP